MVCFKFVKNKVKKTIVKERKEKLCR